MAVDPVEYVRPDLLNEAYQRGLRDGMDRAAVIAAGMNSHGAFISSAIRAERDKLAQTAPKGE